MAGLGFGLPVSRLYAQYFGGDVKLYSVEVREAERRGAAAPVRLIRLVLQGHGCDTYVRLDHIGSLPTPPTSHFHFVLLPSARTRVSAASSAPVRLPLSVACAGDVEEFEEYDGFDIWRSLKKPYLDKDKATFGAHLKSNSTGTSARVEHRGETGRELLILQGSLGRCRHAFGPIPNTAGGGVPPGSDSRQSVRAARGPGRGPRSRSCGARAGRRGRRLTGEHPSSLSVPSLYSDRMATVSGSQASLFRTRRRDRRGGSSLSQWQPASAIDHCHAAVLSSPGPPRPGVLILAASDRMNGESPGPAIGPSAIRAGPLSDSPRFRRRNLQAR
eukprot:759473-Hanusia_phi.AAC.1